MQQICLVWTTYQLQWTICTWFSVFIVCGMLLTGEFGIVYKAQLTEMGTHPSFHIVAVKTLKG